MGAMPQMGGDFTYSNALMWYKNLDKLVALVNAAADNNGRYQVTPPPLSKPLSRPPI
jgi:hypothetical protein